MAHAHALSRQGFGVGLGRGDVNLTFMLTCAHAHALSRQGFGAMKFATTLKGSFVSKTSWK